MLQQNRTKIDPLLSIEKVRKEQLFLQRRQFTPFFRGASTTQQSTSVYEKTSTS
jgi:hypothetical protein